MLMAANAARHLPVRRTRLQHADRYYLTFREMGHNDFIDQGIQKRVLDCEANPDKKDPPAEPQLARAGYESLCEYILDFFDVYLKNPSIGERRSVSGRSTGKSLGGTAPQWITCRRA